jgi:hypothetical protein
MSRSARTLLLVLVALWLPATLHCQLKAVGLVWTPAHADKADCCAAGQPCDRDGCNSIEKSTYKFGDTDSKATLPDFTTGLCLLCLLCLAVLLSGALTLKVNERLDQLSGWIQNWQFVRRAAPPPRAPSMLLA